MVLDDEMEAAATKIQAVFKGHQTRKEIKKAEDEIQPDPEQLEKTATTEEDDIANMVLDDEMEAAATKIQAVFKGHQIRKEMKKNDDNSESVMVIEEKSTADDDDIANMVLDDEMEAAATKIQAVFKGHQTRKEITLKDGSIIQNTEEQPTSFVDDEYDSDMDDEAKKAAFKERHTKIKELKELRKSIRTESANIDNEDDDIANMVLDDEMEAAATKIQAVFKGHQTRKEMKKIENGGDEIDGSVADEILQPGEEESEIPVEEPVMTQVFVSRSGESDSKDESPDAIDIDPERIQHDEEFPELSPTLSRTKSNESERQSDEILEPGQGESEIPDEEPKGEPQSIDEVDQPMIKDNSVDADIKNELTQSEEKGEEESGMVSVDQCNEDIGMENEQILQASVEDQVEAENQEETEENENEEEKEETETATEEEEQQQTEEETNENETETNENDNADDPEEEEGATGSRDDNLTDAEKEDIANLAMDEEMEQAALKIQSTFRGHKTRKEVKDKVETTSGTEDIEKSVDELNIEDGNESNEAEKGDNEEDDVANMVLDEEIEQAALKIQSTFRGHKTRKEIKDKEPEPSETEELEEEQPAEEQNDDDDVANMVLDEEMEQAALKIQSTFRGHKTRKEVKEKQEINEPNEQESEETAEQPNDDDDVANMVLDEEMEQAALKIQSTFRGHKTRKEVKDKQETSETNEEEQAEAEEIKEEEEPAAEKTAKQLQDEEDIANLVMDDDMEKAALRIQSTFRGHKKRGPKKPTDDELTGSSSAGDSSQPEEDQNHERSDQSFIDEDASIVRSMEKSFDRPESFSQRDSDGVEYRSGSERLSGEQSELEARLDESPEMNFSREGTFEDKEMLISSSAGSGDDRFNRDSKDLPSDYDPTRSGDGSQESDKKSRKLSRETNERMRSTDSLRKSKESNDSAGTKASINSAEAMYLSLKNEEMKSQNQLSQERCSEEEEEENSLLGELENIGSAYKGRLSRSGMSLDERNLYKDRLLGLSDSILSQDYPNISKDGSDEFDPFSQASKRKDDFLKQIHGRSELQKSYDVSMDMGDEDQFDDFYPGNIRHKIRLDSVADSDYYDPKQIPTTNDDIRTALETINSSDSDSTIISAATKIQAGARGYITRKRLQSTGAGSTSQYASFGNAAINQSLDDFIER